MPYIVDGHNLIPKIPGIKLDKIDDEQLLIEILQEYCRLSRKELHVYFDNAPPGHIGACKYGIVKAHFVQQGKTADQAILTHLTHLGAAARNWTVVSSDRAVQAAARDYRAMVITSESFANQISATLEQIDTDQDNNLPLTADELDDWLTLFGQNSEPD